MGRNGIGNRLLLLALLPAAFSTTADAAGQERAGSSAPKGLSSVYVACQKQAQGAIERAACLSQEESLQDKRLNRIYQQLLGALDADGKARLVDAQRTWLQSRTKDDALEATLYGNTQVENFSSGEAALFRLCARADQLEHYLRLTD